MLFSSNTGYVVVMSRAGDVVAIKLVPLPAQTLVSGLAVSETLDIVISAHETSDGKERGIFWLGDHVMDIESLIWDCQCDEGEC